MYVTIVDDFSVFHLEKSSNIALTKNEKNLAHLGFSLNGSLKNPKSQFRVYT